MRAQALDGADPHPYDHTRTTEEQHHGTTHHRTTTSTTHTSNTHTTKE
ncbi:hypothetical protein [Microbacterium sp. P02]